MQSSYTLHAVETELETAKATGKRFFSKMGLLEEKLSARDQMSKSLAETLALLQSDHAATNLAVEDLESQLDTAKVSSLGLGSQLTHPLPSVDYLCTA